MIKIKEITNKDGLEVIGKVKIINEGTTNTGSKFLSLTLEDETGIINAKIWDAENVSVALGEIYLFKGSGQEYREKLQLIISTFEPIREEHNVDIDKFFKSAPMDKEDILKQIKEYVYKIDNTIISDIVKKIINKYANDFMSYPAATQNHHSYLSGLSFHSLTMLKMADKFLEIYPFLDKNYLYGGVLLHDFAKVIELSSDRAPEYTLEGKLIGHLVMGDEIINDIAKDLGYADKEEVLLLKHIVLSHHGRKEWGSPQRPMIAEAEAVHFIDNIDSKFESIRAAFEETELNTWTKRIPVLDGRAIYRHK